MSACIKYLYHMLRVQQQLLLVVLHSEQWAYAHCCMCVRRCRQRAFHTLCQSWCRERRALAPVKPSLQEPAQLPELLPGYASPDTIHKPVPRHVSKDRQQQQQQATAEACMASSTAQLNSTHQQAYGDQPGLHAEPTFSCRQDRRVASVAVAACCLRCGVEQCQTVDSTLHCCQILGRFCTAQSGTLVGQLGMAVGILVVMCARIITFLDMLCKAQVCLRTEQD